MLAGARVVIIKNTMVDMVTKEIAGAGEELIQLVPERSWYLREDWRERSWKEAEREEL